MKLLSIDLNFTKKYYFKYQFKSFKKSIIFKRFSIKYTHFDRKQLSTIKHSYNWVLYTQMWQEWIQNFLIIKTLTKYQYFRKFNKQEFLSFNPLHFNTKKTKLLPLSFNFLSCFVSKKIFLLTNKSSLINFASWQFFFKNFSLHFSYTNYHLKTNTIEKEHFYLLFLNSDNQFFNTTTLLNSNYDLNLNLIFNIYQNLILTILKEMYKIFNYMYIYKITNF